MRVDIITPAYDVAPYIGDAIRSVLAQTHRYWTMTIVDDGSTMRQPPSPPRSMTPHPVAAPAQRRGFRARNLGLVASNAEAVLFLDADDWLSPDALATLAEALRTAPNAIAAVGPYQRVPGRTPDQIERGSRICPPPSGDLLKSLLVRNLFANGATC